MVVFKKQVISVNRVTKVVEGGRKFKIAALVAVGDGEGTIGFGIGKAMEVAEAVAKGEKNAKKNMIKIPLCHKTIYHEVHGHYNGNHVFFKPASEGTGIKAGGVARMICEIAGIENILSKNFRRNSAYNSLRAVFDALSKIREPISIAKVRGVSLEKVFNG